MKSKYKFGLAEVAAMVGGSIIVVLLELLFKNYNSSYGEVAKSIIIVICAAVFGYPTGLIVTISSTLLTAAILGLGIEPIVVAAFSLVALAIGFYAERFGIRDGLFTKNEWLNFILIKLMAEIISWLFLTPLFEFMVTRSNLFEMIRFYLFRVIMLTLFDIVILPMLIWINYLCKKRSEKSTLS